HRISGLSAQGTVAEHRGTATPVRGSMVSCAVVSSRVASRFYRPGCAYNGLQLVGFRAAVDEREILDIERFEKTGDGATRYSLGCRPRTSAGRFRIICNSSNSDIGCWFTKRSLRHYFFDMGNDSLLAFFEIPKGKEPAG